MNDEVGKRLSTEERLKSKPRKVDKLRYAEYYGQQETLDRLYRESKETIQKYLDLLKLDKARIQKLNKLRTKAGLEEIERETEKSSEM